MNNLNILFTDLDGTLRCPKSSGHFVTSPDDQQLLPGVLNKIKKYHDKNWIIAGITNQAGVASKHKTFDSCMDEQLYTLKLLPQMHSISFCTDFNGFDGYRVYPTGELKKLPAGRNYRKPNPGMLIQFMEDIICPVMLGDCLMVGDRIEDKEAAKAANIQFAWAEDWRNGK
jgi:D-glycero-D-manno-heptose 1,7-bisphosphate phosphatase